MIWPRAYTLPRSAKVAYTVSMVGFSVITCYMSFCAIYLAVTGIQAFENQGDVTAEDVISDATFRNIILSLAATYGIYLLASLLAFDPWHMCKWKKLFDEGLAAHIEFRSHVFAAIPDGERDFKAEMKAS